MKAIALVSAAPVVVSTKSTGLHVNMVPSDTEEDNTEDEASTTASSPPAQETQTVAKTPSPVNLNLPVDNGIATKHKAGNLL